MELWLAEQARIVLTALSHAQEIYGGSTASVAPRPFALRPDLEADLGRESE